jgi:alpha-N-arabinofuranosidase
LKKAKIITDRHYIKGEVDKNLYGSFVEHIGRCIYEGIYEPDSRFADENGFRLDVIELVRELDVPIMRWPGGNFVSGYNWEDGIGPREGRPPRLELAWGVIESNQFGIDEFADWCKKVETEPLVAVNLGTDSPDSARRMVEYCNHPSGTALSDLRIKHGYKEPHGIKYWCLGNEMDGPWQICAKTAYEYARIANEAAKVMKWVDPSIKLVACGSSGLGMKTFGEWEVTVLDECYDNVDYISLHTYYGNQAKDTPSFLANTIGFNDFIKAVISICDYVKAKKHGRKDIMLSFDEWNVWYHSHNAPFDKWSKQPQRINEDHYNFEDALLVGGMLISLINNCDRVKIACLAQLVNVIGPIMTGRDGIFKQTIFWPFAQASKYGRGTALDLRIDCPKYDAKNYTDVPILDVAAVANEENETISLFIVNKDLEEDVEVTCDLRQYEGYRVKESTELISDDLLTANWFNDEKIRPANTDNAAIDDGILTAVLKPASWNVIILKKQA